MVRGMYISAAGMLPRMTQMDNVANNLSNSVTHGYKQSSVFLRSLIDAQYALDHANGIDRQAAPEDVRVDFTQGSFERTEGTFDIALNGSGFFRVMDQNGEMFYTRDGRFRLDPFGFVVNDSGMYLLNDAARPFQVDGDDVMILETGEVMVDGAVEEVIGLADFADADYPQLQQTGMGLFANPAGINEIAANDNTVFLQGYLEESNVEQMQTMVDMIQLFREYELGQRAIQIQDQSLQRIVTEVGAIR